MEILEINEAPSKLMEILEINEAPSKLMEILVNSVKEPSMEKMKNPGPSPTRKLADNCNKVPKGSTSGGPTTAACNNAGCSQTKNPKTSRGYGK